MSSKLNTAIAVAGIDIGKNSFHVIGLDKRGANDIGTPRPRPGVLAAHAPQTRTTGTVGGGLEWALPYQWRNWSIKAEYMFIGLGHDTLTACGTAITPAGTPVGGGQFCFNHDFSGIHTAKIGLNYRFVLILEFGFLSAARGRQRTHRCYADAVVALSKAFALSTASDAACAISSDFDSFVGSFMLLAWPCASLHSAEPIRTILTGSLARAKSNAPVALKLRRIRTSLFQSKRKSRLLTAGHSQRAWPFSDCLRVNYSRQAHRPLQMTVGLHCTSEVCNGSFSSDRPAPNAVGMSLCADRVRTFAPQRFDAVCQQRNFRGHRFTLPPFAGNPNGVVVYPPYLMGQYCGMLFRIWWH